MSSPREASIVVTGWAAPPDSETRLMVLGAILGVNSRTPSRLQAPPVLVDGASVRVWAGPPDIAIFFSFPSAKKATNRLSGDQKGRAALSVPGTAWAVGEFRARIQSCAPLEPFVAT